MKTVFSTSQAAHVWAQQTQDYGRGSSTHFQGATFYSYSTPIAEMYTAKGGERFVLVSSEKFSSTTNGKHLPAVRSAIRHLSAVAVPCVNTSGGGRVLGASLKAMHARNLESFRSDYAQLVASLKRKHGLNKPAADILARVVAPATLYCRFFKLRPLTLPHIIDGAAIDAHQARVEAKFNAPGAAEKRERQNEKRLAAKQRREAAADEALRVKSADAIAEWLTGAGYRFPYGVCHSDRGALLRVKDEELQTSQGASVPLVHAIKAFRFIRLVRERGEPWNRNGHTVRVGHFQIDRITISGDFHAGCHFIRWTEVERIARAIGVWDDASASDEALTATGPQ